jgi:hypothetical protein
MIGTRFSALWLTGWKSPYQTDAPISDLELLDKISPMTHADQIASQLKVKPSSTSWTKATPSLSLPATARK